MTRILMIALEFAPVQTTGAFRSIDFARYLPEHGFSPYVLTIEPQAGSAIFGARINPVLGAALPPEVTVAYLKPSTSPNRASRLAQFLRIYGRLDDTFFSRFKASLEAALSGLSGKGLRAVYVSAPPFGAARLGELAADRLGLPLVIDMRDAWAEWGMGPYPTYLHFLARYRDEARAFGSAAAIITVTERLADVFRRSHPELPRSRFHVVPNGFDGEKFKPAELTVHEKEVFDIAYVGSYYYSPPKPRSVLRPHSLIQYHRGREDWSYRSPLYFFRAWRQMAKNRPADASRMRFHHIGHVPDWLEPMIAEHGLTGQCKLWGILPKQELAPLLSSMDAQLATSMKRVDGGDYCLASKTFDYLTAGKPIVGFVTEGSQRDFLTASGAAVICDPDRPNESAEKLSLLMRGEARLTINETFLNEFHRRRQAERLAAILRSASKEQPPAPADAGRPEPVA